MAVRPTQPSIDVAVSVIVVLVVNSNPARIVRRTGFGVLCFDGYCALLSAEGHDQAVHESGMSEKAEAERVEAVHKTGSQWKRAEGREFEGHIEMVSLGRAAAPSAECSRWLPVQGIEPQRMSKRHREGAEIRSAIHEAKTR